MGAIAAKLADQVIVTSDNPRNESPEEIIADIMTGIPETSASITIQVDRARAIRAAVSNAEADDIVLIAGKGHEDYQEVHGERLPFSDIEIARAALAAKKESGHVAA